jgi:hypothetical protein
LLLVTIRLVTHSGARSAGVIQPYGKSFTLPDITIEFTVVDGKITRQQDPPPPPGKAGYEILPDLLGVKLPKDRAE